MPPISQRRLIFPPLCALALLLLLLKHQAEPPEATGDSVVIALDVASIEPDLQLLEMDFGTLEVDTGRTIRRSAECRKFYTLI